MLRKKKKKYIRGKLESVIDHKIYCDSPFLAENIKLFKNEFSGYQGEKYLILNFVIFQQIKYVLINYLYITVPIFITNRPQFSTYYHVFVT